MINAATGLSLVVALMVAALVVEPNLTSFYTIILVPITIVLLIRRQVDLKADLYRHRVGIGSGIGFLLAAGVSVLWAETDTAIVLQRLLKLTGQALALLAVFLVPVSRSSQRAVGTGLVIGAIAIALFLIETRLTGAIRNILSSVDDTHVWYNLHKPPATILALLVFPAGMILLHRCGNPLRRTFGTVAGLVLICGALLSGHLTAVFAFGTGAILVAIGFFWPRLVAASIWIGAAMMLFIAPVVLTQSDINPLLSMTASEKSLQHRVLILDFAAERIAERPWLGWGLDNSRFLPNGSERIADTPGRLGQRIDPDVLHQTVLAVAQNLPLHPHNLFFQVRLELGVPGGIMLLLALAAALHGVIRIHRRSDRALSLGAVTTAMIIASAGFGAWQSWWIAAIILTVACTRFASSAKK